MSREDPDEASPASAVEELSFFPSSVAIVATRVDGDIEDPAYIMKVETPDGDIWPCLRRWSACRALYSSLTADGNPALKDFPFPRQRLFGVLPNSEEGEKPASVKRKEQLAAWLTEAAAVCPGNQILLTFLADDNSVSTAHALELGIAVISSAPSRKFAGGTKKAPENEGAVAEHRQRIKRRNNQVLAALDLAPVRVRVTVAPVTRTNLDPDFNTKDKPQPEPASEPASSNWFSALKKAAAETFAEVSSAVTANDQDRWLAYHILCISASSQCWIVSRGITDILGLRSRLLKSGNPAVRSIEFATRIGDMLSGSVISDLISDRCDLFA
jgi:hypothetical protein